ncbi:MAG: PQQ-dependent sugar dehydrogenase [Pseudomonadota bacterium]|nr:PQQ-dependent sugar dehydrogenase [Pseudomonadota bacterium]
MRRLFTTALTAFLASGCGAQDVTAGANGVGVAQASQAGGRPFQTEVIAKFDQPWAMTFLPGGNQALITEQRGRLLLWTPGGQAQPVAGAPQVAYGGQGGLGDVIVHPDFANNRMIYLSWVEAGAGGKGAVVGRAQLAMGDGAAPRLENMQIIWRQDPKVSGNGHFGHRLAFSPDGFLYISSGEREKFTPAQDMNANLGKILRVTDAGGIPSDNPFTDQGGGAVRGAIWSLGHRNVLGLAFDERGQLWADEMGPKNGDEFNRIERGSNYGWPVVSNGNNYDGKDIPDHSTRPDFNAPEITWNGLSPSGMVIYSGSQFPQWRGNAFLGGLSGKTLVRVEIDGTTAREAERWDMGQRIREVEQGPDGAIYVLEDQRNGSGGRLLKLTPAR